MENYLREQSHQLIQERSNRLGGNPILNLDYFVIPVVFHVVYDPALPATNIPFERIVSQLNVMNDLMNGGLSNQQDAKIQFCLAQSTGSELIDWDNEYEKGVMRYSNAALSHHNVTIPAENSLMDLTNAPGIFSFEKYLNIWVVTDISNTSSGTLIGYSPQPLLGNSSSASGLDGLVMRYDAIGSQEDDLQNEWPFFPSLNLGKVIVHELGHYFNLYHVFHMGCMGLNHSEALTDNCESFGDFVCDTPPQYSSASAQDYICGSDDDFPNTCNENYSWSTYLADQTHNHLQIETATDAYDFIGGHMNYSLDACRQTFTAGQVLRMHAYITLFRSVLSSETNLVETGIAGGSCIPLILSAAILTDNYQGCVNDIFTFTTLTGEGYSSTSWEWDFGDGSAHEYESAVSHQFTSAGSYVVSFVSSDGIQSVSNSIVIFVSNCSIGSPEQVNWVYGQLVALDFSQGYPVFSDIAVNPPNGEAPTMKSYAACVSVSDETTGELLFYSDGYNVWRKEGNKLNDDYLLPFGVLDDPYINSCGYEVPYHQNTRSMAYAPYPNHPGEYFLLIPVYNQYIYQFDAGGISVIHVNLNDGEYGSANYLGEISDQFNYTYNSERIEVIPHCNGVDYWILFYNNQTFDINDQNIQVYLLSELGFSNADMSSNSWDDVVVEPDVYSFPHYAFFASNDGELLLGGGDDNYLETIVYEFDNTTGSFQQLYNMGITSISWSWSAAFSPNNESIYYLLDGYIWRLPTIGGVAETIASGNYSDIIIGPETLGFEKLYVTRHIPGGGDNRISALNTPDEEDPQFQEVAAAWPESCATSESNLPDFIKGKRPAVAELFVNYNNISCFEYAFSIPSCFQNYSILWEFGDGASLVNSLSTTHEYEESGIYMVTVTVSRANGLLSESASVELTIQEGQGNFLAQPNPICVGELQELTVVPDDAIEEYTWMVSGGGLFGNGTSTTSGMYNTIVWSEPGIWTVTLTGIAQNEFCPDVSNSIEVVVNSLPTFEVNTACLESSIDITSGAAPFDVAWYDQQGNLVGGQAEIVLPGNDYYSIQVTDNNGCTSTQFLDYSESAYCCPLPGLSTNFDQSTNCQWVIGANIEFSNSTTIAGATFIWNFGDGQSASGQFVTHTYSEAGNYTATLTINTPECPDVIVEHIVAIFPFDYQGVVAMNTDAQAEANAGQWNNNNQSFGADIIFGDGTNVINVTVQDAVFVLGPGVDIIINENASVTFNRCTFTSCSTWEGFNVRSNSQTAATSGILRMDVTNVQDIANFSVIENARIGIEVRDERTNASVTATDLLQGGRVYCGRTRFVNCKQAFNAINANFKSSYFKLCQFNVDDAIVQHYPDINLLPGYNEMTSLCRHHRSIGYNYYGCSWTNSMTTGMDNWTNRGIGVNTSVSTLTITHFTTNNNQNLVQGTTQGFDIGLQQSSKGGRVTLSYQNFQQNHIGAYFNGGMSHRAYKNNFVIGGNTNVLGLDEDEEYGTFPGNSTSLGISMATSYEGLVLRNVEMMEIAENTFTGVLQTDELDNDGDNNDGVSSDYSRLGIRIRSTNTEDMVVRKNTLSKMNYANLANADNASGLGTSGLRYICNVNSNNLQDFTNTDFVGSPGSATIGLVQQEPATTYPAQQGTIIWPTGNILSTDPDGNEDTFIHFRNEGVGVEYWHLNQGGSGNQTPADATGLTYVSTSDFHSCPAKYVNPILVPHTPSAISGLVGSGLISKVDADQYQYVYLLLLDGGNTAALEQYVDDTWGSQVWATRQHLLSLSPYLTESVMLSVLDNTQVYPHAIAFEILLANPDLLNDPKMADYLSIKAEPMPQYLIDLLLAYSAGGSGRGEMEKGLAVKRTSHITKLSEALWSMMDYYEDDTYTELDFEQVIGDIGSLNAEMALVEMLLDKGDVNTATIRAEDIPNVVNFGKGEGDEYDAFMDWITLRKDMMSTGRDWSTMNGSDISGLEDLLSRFDTYAASQAMAVLNEYTSTDYFIPPAYGANGMLRRARVNADDITANMLKVYPNPADYLVTIELKEPLPTIEMCTLIITDVMGREIYNQQINPAIKQFLIDTKDWVVGLYAFKIVVPNSPIELNGKFDVVH